MKNIFLSLVLVLATGSMFGQTVFDKFEDQEDVTTVIVNKKMFSLISKMKVDDKETQQYVNLIKKLENLKVFLHSSLARSKNSSSLIIVTYLSGLFQEFP